MSRFRLALMLLIALPACAAGPKSSPVAEAVRHVVVITIDGLRGDAIAAAGASTLQQLQKDGASTLTARVVAQPETLPGHVTMATGVSPQVHGVRTNHELGYELGRPTIYTAAHDAGLRTGLYVGKVKLKVLAPDHSADVVHGPGPGDADWASGSSARLAAEFASEFPREKFALAWLHLREPDLAGHKQGWMSDAYLAAVRETDRAVAAVVRAIDDAGLWPSTTLIVTSDHGGHAMEHYSRQELDWLIPWICRGPAAKPGAALRDARTLDVAPTVLALLALPPLPGMEGHAVEGCAP